MRRLLIALLLLPFIAAPSWAQAPEFSAGVGAAGGMTMLLFKDAAGEVQVERVGQLFTAVSAEWPLDHYGENTLVVDALYDGEEMGGVVVSFYKDLVGGNAVAPGVGLGTFVLGNDREFIDNTTVFFGGQFGLNFSTPDALALTASVYKSQFGDGGKWISDVRVALTPALWSVAK
jgi:hypothetical protein